MIERKLGFDFALMATSDAPQLRTSVRLDDVPPSMRQAHLREMAATIPWSTISSATRIFAAAEGETFATKAEIDGQDFTLGLPYAIVSEPWRIAVLANLIDFSLGEADKELRLADRITLFCGATNTDIRIVFEDLARQKEEARAVMTKRLPRDFWLDQYSGPSWPSEPDEYRFAVSLELSRPLTHEEQAEIGETLQNLENLVAWMAFETEETSDEWVASGRMIFSGDTKVEARALYWIAEFPPSDIALPLLLLERVLLRRHGITPADWHIDITPRR